MSKEIDDYLFQRLKYVVDGRPDQVQLSKLGDLHDRFKKLKDYLESPVPQNPEIKPEEWPKLRREKLYYLNNLLTEWQSITKKWGIYTPEAISSAYHLVKKLDKVKKELKGGDGTGTTHPHVEEPKDDESLTMVSATYRWSSRFVDPNKVHGLDAKAMSLERALVGTGREADDSFKAIGIVGMPGIGKTTLAQLIFSRDKVKEYFLPRIWVSMSKQPNKKGSYDIKEIVERILRSLGVDEEFIMMTFEQRRLEGLIFALRVQLMDKRYLIVLDDVEENFEKLNSSGLPVKNKELMKKLEYGLPKGCGGTVIVTSRNEKVAKEMVGEENLHTMKPLTDPDSCWLIFKDWVEKGNTNFPRNLEGFKDEIVKKCGGLPLSAKMMGQIVNQRLNQPRPQARQQLQAENQQPTEQPEKENQQPAEQLPMENQQQKEQPQRENQQQSDQLLTKNHQPTEEPQPEYQQPVEKLQMENQELPQTENQELTEQQENQQLTKQPEKPQPTELETENWELIEKPQPEEPKTENQKPQPEEPKMENQQQQLEQPKTENQQQLLEQPKTENQQQQLEQPKTENQLQQLEQQQETQEQQTKE